MASHRSSEASPVFADLLRSAAASGFTREDLQALTRSVPATSSATSSSSSSSSSSSIRGARYEDFLSRAVTAGHNYPSSSAVAEYSRLQQDHQLQQLQQLAATRNLRFQQQKLLLQHQRQLNDQRQLNPLASLLSGGTSGSSPNLMSRQQPLWQQPSSLDLLLERQRLLQSLESNPSTQLARALASVAAHPRPPAAASSSRPLASEEVATATPAVPHLWQPGDECATVEFLMNHPSMNHPSRLPATTYEKKRSAPFPEPPTRDLLGLLLDRETPSSSPRSSSSSPAELESVDAMLCLATTVAAQATVPAAKKPSSPPALKAAPPKKRKTNTSSSSSSRKMTPLRQPNAADEKDGIPHFSQREYTPLGIDEDTNWLSSFQCYGRCFCFICFIP